MAGEPAAHPDPARAQPRAARAPAAARAREEPAAEGARAYRRHPGPVRALDVRRAVVASRGLRARRPDARAGAAQRRPGDPDAGHDPPRLEARLLALRGRDPRRAPRGVAEGLPAPPRREEDRGGGAEGAQGARRRADVARRARRGPRQARRAALQRDRDGGGPGPRAAVGDLGAPPRRRLRARRGLGRQAGCRPERRTRPARAPLPRRLRARTARLDRELGRPLEEDDRAGPGAHAAAAIRR